MNNNTKNDSINGVKCHVTNCKHHAGENCCTANKIEINSCGKNCSNSSETDCATFAPME